MKLLKKTAPADILQALSDTSGFTPEELISTTGGGLSHWKHLGMYIARKRGLTLKQVGDLFGRHFSTVTLAERKVEKALAGSEDVAKIIDAVNNHIDHLNE